MSCLCGATDCPKCHPEHFDMGVYTYDRDDEDIQREKENRGRDEYEAIMEAMRNEYAEGM
jgi:hypothetical protein